MMFIGSWFVIITKNIIHYYYSYLIFTLGRRLSRRKKTSTDKEIYPRGVRKSDYYYNNTIYVKYGKSRGVRKDGVVYKTYGKPKHTLNHMLHYSRPCVCGSLTHMRTSHVNCMLNPRYLDAY